MTRAGRRPFAAAILLVLAFRASADTTGDDLARENPTPCMTMAAPLTVTYILQRDIHGYLRALGRGHKLSAGWARGNPHYDRAFALILDALNAEERTHGPLATIDMRRYVADSLSRGDAKTRAALGEYLRTPVGHFTWKYFVDDANCGGTLDAFDEEKTSFSDTQRVTIGTLRWRLEHHRDEYNDGYEKLTKAEQDSVVRYSTLIGNLLLAKDARAKQSPARFGIDDFVLIRKLGADLGGTESKVIALIDAFERQPAI